MQRNRTVQKVLKFIKTRQFRNLLGFEVSKMAKKYRRLKSVGYLLVASEKGRKNDVTDEEDDQGEKREDGQKERVVPYENKPFIIVILIFTFVELLKNSYFLCRPVSLNNRLLYGDIMISFQEDQRLFNFVMLVCCLASFVYCSFLLFGEQTTQYSRLSKFLLMLNTSEYGRRLLVSKRFAELFAKTLDRGVLANQLVFANYLIFDTSFYSRGIYKAIRLGISLQQILTYICPSILIGFFAHFIFYRIAIQAYILYILYVRLMNARWARLTRNLDKLDDRPNGRRRLSRHFAELDSVLSEYKVSRHFFEGSLMLTVFPVLSTIGTFPTIIMFSENLLTNQIVPMFFFNLFAIFVPIVKSNEKFKRAFSLYLNSVHRFMARTRNARAKLKLMKLMDINQTEHAISYTLLGGIFELETKIIPIILSESFSFSFLIFSFWYYIQT